jgi:Xaa-Pro aminopeptidase
VKRAKLIIASSEASADLLYATKFRAPDDFVFVEAKGKKALLLSDLEVDRGRREAQVDEVAAYSELEKEVQGTKKKKPSFVKVVAAFLKKRGARSVVVPSDFPLGYARRLTKENIRVRPARNAFYPERQIKTGPEIAALEAALRITEAGLARGIEILKAAAIRKDGRLSWNKRVLTAETLRQEIEVAIVRAGGQARGDTIVACGDQACDPHERGCGPLLAHQLIILDIFPRDARSGYFGDMTRTVVRGKASEAQRHLWATCLEGQRRALEAMKPGAPGQEIHESIKSFFAENGYPTEIRDGRWQGFFHGTGHGLGLEIHETPRFSAAKFQPGQVITVEPGIYIPGLGGVRHEDVALVTDDGIRVLSNFPKPLEI